MGRNTNFCFTWDGCDAANLATFKCVDDAAFTHIGIPDEPNRYLLLVGMQLCELAKELDQRTFSKGVVGRGVERDRWVSRGEVLDVSGL